MSPAERRLALGQALALGLVHGPAELLPVSSSAHTSLLPWLAGWDYDSLPAATRKDFEVALHAAAGAALASPLYEEARAAWRGPPPFGLLAWGISLPALAGLMLERTIERRLGSPGATALGLLAGALALALGDRTPTSGTRELVHADWRDGLALGLAQATALAPGVSRGGATLATARARGFGRADAHALSWTVGLPVILAPLLLRGRGLAQERGDLAPAAAGAAAAFVSTRFAARALRRARGAREAPLSRYAAYRSLLAVTVLVIRRRRAK